MGINLTQHETLALRQSYQPASEPRDPLETQWGFVFGGSAVSRIAVPVLIYRRTPPT